MDSAVLVVSSPSDTGPPGKEKRSVEPAQSLMWNVSFVGNNHLFLLIRQKKGVRHVMREILAKDSGLQDFPFPAFEQ